MSKKITDLDSLTTPAGEDTFELVDDPSGTPISKKVTLTNLITNLIASFTATLTNKTIDGDNNTISNLAHGSEVNNPSSGVHGVTGSVVGTTDTQTLTNKDISSATNTYRSASDTATGAVELATTAETTTGTDATRAVTPDGLHDMTSLAGAAWFLDEDTMSSDSATKVPSQQSVKAYVDTEVAGVGLSSKIITSTRDMTAASGSVGYTGVGFIPTSIHAISNINGAAFSSQGFSDSAGAEYQVSRRNDGNFYSDARLIVIDTAAGAQQQAVVASYDADGFTLTWTKVGTPGAATAQLIFICYK